MSLDLLLGIAGLLLLLCVFANKISDKFGIPSLLLFLGMGMLAGSDGVGGIQFYDAKLSNYIGTVALAFILFSGGLDTQWRSVRPIIARGTILSTCGVFLTAVFLYLLAYYVIRLPFEISLLLSVIVSSTDAPAVFSVLRSKGLRLQNERLKSVLEFESGSNDPMAVLLSMGAISMLSSPDFSLTGMLEGFFWQMCLGIIMGLIFGRLAAFVLERWSFVYQGLYPVFGVGVVFLIFSATQMLRGNGFLAIYLAGIVIGNTPYMYRRQFIRFQDSLAWIMQISMFLILGLLVNPHELVSVLPVSFAASLALMFIARPLAVFLCLFRSEFSCREKLLISWAGLKGSVPIILATYPLMVRFPNSQFLFNLIFFLVIISVLAQGNTLPALARFLKINATRKRRKKA